LVVLDGDGGCSSSSNENSNQRLPVLKLVRDEDLVAFTASVTADISWGHSELLD